MLRLKTKPQVMSDSGLFYCYELGIYQPIQGLFIEMILEQEMNDIKFKDVDFNVQNLNGNFWLTTTDISKALYGYGERVRQIDSPFGKGFSGKVNRLYNRHSEEFTLSMTQLIELETAGGAQQVRVFSLRGAHLLGMLARTERAKEFRRWVLDVLEEKSKQQNSLTTRYHKTMLEFAQGRATASLCGRGLSEWKNTKPRIEKALKNLEHQLQPALFEIQPA